MKYLKNFLIIISSALALSSQAQSTATFSYACARDKEAEWGYKMKEDFDVAIYISSPDLVGKKIKSVTVPIIQYTVENPQIWLTSKLTLSSRKNVADICTVDAKINGKEITATFDEPYTITEDGVYVGYSISCPYDNYNPVLTVEKSVPGSFFIHTSRHQLSWKDKSEELNQCSRINITLEGDFPVNGAGVASIKDVMEDADAEFVASATMKNLGCVPVKSFDYKVVSESGSFSGSVNVPGTSVANNYLEEFDVQIPLGNIFDKLGDNPYTLTITRVNGMENKAENPSGTGHVHIKSYTPVNRPLLEEYTGVYCKWCPRGMAAIERMYRLYPDDFIAVAYHVQDDMEITRNFPNKVQAEPDAFINRHHECDPYFANGSGSFLIENLWNDFRKQSVPVGVELDVTWNNPEKTQVRVESSAIFARSADQQYSMTYILVSDNLQDETWGQANAYSGNPPTGFIEEMLPYLQGPSTIYDMVYNDVVAMTSDYAIDNSLPRNPEINTENKYVYIFDLDKAISLKAHNMVSDKNSLRVVASVVDESGKVINSNMAKIRDVVNVDKVAEDSYTVDTQYYSLDGTRVDNPTKGLYVKVELQANGQQRSSKVVL